MPVFNMGVKCTVYKRRGNDVYGQPLYAPGVPTKVGVVKMQEKRIHSTVRSDSSGTRGHAEEATADVIVLMSKKLSLGINDKIEFEFITTRVMGIMPRYDVLGRLDHFQVECSIE